MVQQSVMPFQQLIKWVLVYPSMNIGEQNQILKKYHVLVVTNGKKSIDYDKLGLSKVIFNLEIYNYGGNDECN
jgi:hypothetical protein